MRKQIYLYYAASTPIDPKVWKAMLPFLKKEYGNPSSMHSFGQRARAAIEQAREKVAKFLNCTPLEVIFTSGATEANNLAIQGIIKKFQNQNFKAQVHSKTQTFKPHIITSRIEHESVRSVCQDLELEGIAEVTYLPVTKEGFVRPEDVQNAIKENTVLISLMYGNSEIGTIQPIAEIGEMLKPYKIRNTNHRILFHTDAVQAAHYLDCDVQKLGVDLLTLSGHKIYGPKGIGVLYVRNGVSLRPLIIGGGQETGLRSGTENVSAIVGLGAAIEEIQNPRTMVTNIKIRQLRDTLIKILLRRIPGSTLNGSLEKRLQNNINVCLEGVEGREVVMALDEKGIGVSTGSACSERTQEPSHVLLALGLTPTQALSSIRITLGKYTTREEIEKAAKVLGGVVAKLRKNR